MDLPTFFEYKKQSIEDISNELGLLISFSLKFSLYLMLSSTMVLTESLHVCFQLLKTKQTSPSLNKNIITFVKRKIFLRKCII